DTVTTVEGFAVGETPPDFTLVDAEGNLVSLSDFPDQRVMVVGTASW
ncbi:MAG: peroxiredoxin, partial [Myxococcota bacterium]